MKIYRELTEQGRKIANLNKTANSGRIRNSSAKDNIVTPKANSKIKIKNSEPCDCINPRHF